MPHILENMNDKETSQHECNGDNYPECMYGPAIGWCIEYPAGEFWVSNGEYASQVNYCPYCGTKAPIQVESNK